jgi:hypothetical protein
VDKIQRQQQKNMSTRLQTEPRVVLCQANVASIYDDRTGECSHKPLKLAVKPRGIGNGRSCSDASRIDPSAREQT